MEESASQRPGSRGWGLALAAGLVLACGAASAQQGPRENVFEPPERSAPERPVAAPPMPGPGEPGVAPPARVYSPLSRGEVDRILAESEYRGTTRLSEDEEYVIFYFTPRKCYLHEKDDEMVDNYCLRLVRNWLRHGSK